MKDGFEHDSEWLDEINSLYRHIFENPPSCFSLFDSIQQDSEPSVVHPEVPDLDTVANWMLRCKCGCDYGTVLGPGYDYDGKRVTVSPLTFECGDCASKGVFFDRRIHGYDGELVHHERETPPPEEDAEDVQPVECGRCGNRSLRVFGLFAYADFDHIEDEPDLASRCQDYFDVAGFHGICTSCGQEVKIADFECA